MLSELIRRFLHHAELVTITGKSYRLENQACGKQKEKV